MVTFEQIAQIAGFISPWASGLVLFLVKRTVATYDNRLESNEKNINTVTQQMQAMREELPKTYLSSDGFREHKADMTVQLTALRSDLGEIRGSVGAIFQLLARR